MMVMSLSLIGDRLVRLVALSPRVPRRRADQHDGVKAHVLLRAVVAALCANLHKL